MKIRSRHLSLSQQKIGRIKLLSFSFVNGIALTFITGNVLSLFLLKIGISTSVVAVIISFGYAGTLFVFFGKRFLGKVGASSTIRTSWILCGISAILLSIIPFAYNQKIVTNAEILLIGIVFLTYSIFKSIGTSAIPPLMGEYTDKDNRGSFSSRYSMLYSVATIIAILVLFFLYSDYKTLFVFQIIILTGGVLKIVSSFIFKRIPESTVPMESAKVAKIDKLFSIIWKNKEYRNFLIFKSLARASLIVVIPISILALKVTYQVDDQIALIFACTQLLGGFFVTYLYSLISDYTGSKPLIIINVLALSVICLLWVYTPKSFIWEYCTVIFFLGGCCLFGLESSLNYYYLSTIPRKQSVGVSLWFTIIGGAVAGIAGIVLGGGLIKLYTMLAPCNHVFKYYYASMLFFLIPILYHVCTLKSSSSKKDLSVKDVLKLFIAPLKIYSLYSLQQQNKYSSTAEELDFVEKLQGVHPDLIEERLLYFLESPDFFVRSSALLAMYNLHLKASAKVAIYKALKSLSHISPLIASIILARNNYTKALPLFRKRLTDPDVELVSSSVIALAIMEDKESYKTIINIFKESGISPLATMGARAIALMKDKSTLGCLLEKLSQVCSLDDQRLYDQNIDGQSLKRSAEKLLLENEIVLAISNIISCSEIYYKYLRLYWYDKDKGPLELIDLIDYKIDFQSSISMSPSEMVIYSYEDRTDLVRKKNLIKFLIEAMDRKIPEMRELAIFKDYLIETDPNVVSRKLNAAIFIKIFCKPK